MSELDISKLGKLKVLLIEDDETFRKVMTNVIELLGFEVREAENGLIGKTIFDLNREYFDLVISDVRMPELDGVEVLKHIREHNQKVKFILMTGFSDLLEAKQAHDLGANEFLTKPFRLDSVKNVIHECFYPKSKENSGSQGDDGRYCRIAVEEFITSSALVCDLFVKLSDDKYIRIALAGDVVPVERLMTYKEKRVDFFYVKPEDLAKLVGFNLKITKLAGAKGAATRDVKLKLLTSTASLITQSYFFEGFDREDLQVASQVIDNTINMVGDDPNIMSLLKFLQGHGDQYAHSVAIAVYSCMIAGKMGMTSQTVQVRLAMGGLLHDIGKKELPEALLSKNRLEMTPMEVKLYESHCQRGKDLLSDIPGVPEDVVQIAAHHHENNAGTGFPYGLTGPRIYPLAKIVGVADCFFHTCFKLGGKDKSNVEEAIKKMAVLHALNTIKRRCGHSRPSLE